MWTVRLRTVRGQVDVGCGAPSAGRTTVGRANVGPGGEVPGDVPGAGDRETRHRTAAPVFHLDFEADLGKEAGIHPFDANIHAGRQIIHAGHDIDLAVGMVCD